MRIPYLSNNHIVIINKMMAITTSNIPICPRINKDGARIADMNGINDKTLMNIEPSNKPAIIAK